MRIRVGCSFEYEFPYPTPLLMAVRARQAYHHRVVEETCLLNPEMPLHEYEDGFGNLIWRLKAPAGKLRLAYDAIAEVSPDPDPVLMDLPKTPVEALPDNVIVYTLPSRHCPSDLFISDAWARFGHISGGWAQVQAVCDWLHENIRYSQGSTSTTTGWDAYQQGAGVCRDFAHLGVSFCRALNFPARYVCGYLPDINVPFDPAPMDFHAWFEVYIEGAWRTFDARHNKPRTGRVLIAWGRDAVDVAFATVFGSATLADFRVWANQVDENVRLKPLTTANRL